MASKPVIILVHGAWHTPKSYQGLKAQLEGLGYECYCPQLGTVGENVEGVTWEADVKAIRDVALPLFAQGKEAIIVAHSYGGLPTAIATEGLSAKERAAQGKKGGFIKAVYVAAFAVPQKGMDLFDTFGKHWPDWADFASPYSKNHAIEAKDAAVAAFYSDMPGDEARKWFELVVPQSQDAFETPVPYSAADITVPKTYVITEKDQCVPTFLQEMLSENCGFVVKRFDSGHCPFLSKPEEFFALLKNIIEVK